MRAAAAGAPRSWAAARGCAHERQCDECRDEEDSHCAFPLMPRYTASTKSFVVQEPVSDPYRRV